MRSFLSVAALQLQFAEKNFNPGAGIGVTTYGEAVHKDGFTAVECLTDNMYHDADKYGHNAQSYSNKFNVSIVRYVDVVGREKQRPMRPQVCFDFCRTVHDMHFFGLTAGRDCYCTPYYHRKTSGGGVCDLPCEGDSAVMCGGAEMMNVFEMHQCGSTADDLEAALKDAHRSLGLAKSSGSWGEGAAAMFESAANSLKLESNNIGDMSSHDLAQQMKAHTATVLHAAEKASAAGTALETVVTASEALEGNDFTVADNVYEAEEAIRELKKLGEKAFELGSKAKGHNDALFPPIDGEAAFNGAKLFVPVLEAVDRWAETATDTTDAATTCMGELATTPSFGQTKSECAESCNRFAHEGSDEYCVGFQHFYMGDLALSASSTSSAPSGECVDRIVGWHEYNSDFCDEDGHCGIQGGNEEYTCAYYQQWYGSSGNPQACKNEPYPGQQGMIAQDVCCACNAGRMPALAKPNTGICFLFKEVKHVYKYVCEEDSASDDTCENEDDWTCGDADELTCDYFESFPEYCASTADECGGTSPAEACCFCQDVLENAALTQAAVNRTSAKVTKEAALAGKRAHKKRAHKKVRAKKAKRAGKAQKALLQKQKRSIGVVASATELTTANHCMMRFSSIHRAPFKPEYEEFNACLDTGELVATGTSGTDKKK
jgi:hypothetical protein